MPLMEISKLYKPPKIKELALMLLTMISELHCILLQLSDNLIQSNGLLIMELKFNLIDLED